MYTHSKTRMLAIYIIFFAFQVIAQPEKTLDASELELAIKKLNVLGSVLYIAAHPDDENTSALAYFESGMLLRTGYCSMNRGDGGQNLLGNEQSDLLGVIRTQELLAARRLDGAEQFFTRAIDFGYSKNPEETFKIWNKEKILSDVVWIIRKFRPDVVITRFPDTGEGGHGHHTASAILAKEAFNLAGDPSVFPEQLKYVKPWQPKRIFWNAWRSLLENRNKDLSSYIHLDLGSYNSLLGKSYTEIAAESRSMHKSQGFGMSARRGTELNYFVYLKGDSVNNDMFEGIDLSWNRVKGSEKVSQLLSEIEKEFNPENPSASLPKLMEAYSEMNKLNDDYWVPLKKKELLDVIRVAAGIWIEAFADDHLFTPGDSVKITAGIVERSDYPFTLKNFKVSGKFLISVLPVPIVLNKNIQRNNYYKTDVSIKLPDNIPYTQPYWLAKPHDEGTYNITDQQLIGKPENDPPLNADFVLSDGKIDFTLSVPVLFHWTDAIRGEEFRPVEIAPEVVLNFNDKLYLFPDNKNKVVTVNLTCNRKNSGGKLYLNAPGGWKIEPPEYDFKLDKTGDEKSFTFYVTPPAVQSESTLQAVVKSEGHEFTQGIISINYPHIPIQTLFPPAEAKLVRLNINKTINNIGYIMGSGDIIPEYLKQLGYNVKLISDDELDSASNLNQFDAIITGIRAYNTRERLAIDQPKLMQYVKDGGTLVVQYNTLSDMITDNIGPYPLSISHDRITVEDSPVTFDDTSSPLLNYPNKITRDDFNGWVQERGLYFADKWDQNYKTVISGNDPGEAPLKGGLLYTNYGKGVFIYTGYSWFRQIPSGVAGAFRIFINLISTKQNG